MADIITTLHPINDNNTNIYPNVKIENIPQLPNSKLPDSITLEKIPQMDNSHLPDEIEENKIPSDITASKIGEGLLYHHIINIDIEDGSIFMMFDDGNETPYNSIQDLDGIFSQADAFIPVSGYKDINNIVACKFQGSDILMRFSSGSEESTSAITFLDSVILAR